MLYYLPLLHSADKIDVVLPTAMVIFEVNSETLDVVYVWTFHSLSTYGTAGLFTAQKAKRS